MSNLCPQYGILPCFMLDLTTSDSDGRAWDFEDLEMQRRAWEKIEREQPLLIIGSPIRTASQLGKDSTQLSATQTS